MSEELEMELKKLRHSIDFAALLIAAAMISAHYSDEHLKLVMDGLLNQIRENYKEWG